MTTILLDPTLRRARIVRVTVAVLLCSSVAAATICAAELRGRPRAAPSLPSPRRTGKAIGRRPVCGQRPPIGRRVIRRSARATTTDAIGITRPRDFVSPSVTAFIEPSVTGALDSLRAHARQITTAAFTGVLLGDDGAIVDRVDRHALGVARDAGVGAMVLVQNLDERDGSWRGDRVRRLAADRAARARLGQELVRLCHDERLGGAHLDLEDLGEDWMPLVPIADDVGHALRAAGLRVIVDLPAAIDPGVLARVARVVDGVVVMAYDEHDADGPPGAIASDAYVETALAGAASHVAAAKLTAGLAMYGYDWIDGDSGDPISFVDAHAAARDAHADVSWDPAGNAHVQYADDEGRHDVWLTDAASVWNQARTAREIGIGAVALWRLGGEDPGVWQALADLGSPPVGAVPADGRIINVGDGPFLALSLAPEAGRRRVGVDAGRIVTESWAPAPAPYLVRRAGIVPGEVALTFDDGPDPRFTPAILDVLAREQVPASFFVVGAQAARAPDLVRRAWAEGHTIGNHSFTHPNVDTVGDLRLRSELESTSQLVESIIGRRPLLYRPPSLADIEPRSAAGAAAFARAGSLGYLVVDADVDPRDWEQTSVDRLVADTLDAAAHGGVILLHDGGGDRSATVAALPRIIDGLRARGLRLVALPQLVGKQRDDVMPPPRHGGIGAAVSHAALAGGLHLVALVRALLWLAIALVAFRAAAVIVAAILAERRGARGRVRRPLPSVTAVIPAFNERAVIGRTIDSVLASDVPVDVVVVDDGSTDETAAFVASRYRRDARVRVVRQANGGKAAALRAGFALCRTEAVVALDADTLFAPTTIRRLIEPLCDPCVAAVAGTAEVGNLENALARWQACEYLVQQELERRAWSLFGAVPIVPGAVGAWRREAVVAAGGFASETLAEDADLAMTLCRRRWRVVHAPAARARTEAPTTLAALVKQRRRWSFGILQALWKHRRALGERHAFGRIVWPAMLLFQMVLPLLAPMALLALGVALVAGNWQPALVAATIWIGAEAVQLAAALALAARAGTSDAWRLAGCIITSRVFYRPLLLGITLRSIGRLLDGVPLGWGKLTRRNTVVAYAAATQAARSAR